MRRKNDEEVKLCENRSGRAFRSSKFDNAVISRRTVPSANATIVIRVRESDGKFIYDVCVLSDSRSGDSARRDFHPKPVAGAKTIILTGRSRSDSLKSES